MTGKAYYLTTLGDWQRHAARFANSHWIALVPTAPAVSSVEAQQEGPPGRRLVEPGGSVVPSNLPWRDAADPPMPPPEDDSDSPQQSQVRAPCTIDLASAGENPPPANADTRILVLIEADEGVHLSLEDDPAFEVLPHPLAQKPIPPAAQSALAPHGVAPGATTFDAAEALARLHPLLRHRVF
jgi:hypothetical protein